MWTNSISKMDLKAFFTTAGIFILVVVFVLALLYFINWLDRTSRAREEEENKIKPTLTGEEVVAGLDSLGYFDYAEEEIKDSLMKKEIDIYNLGGGGVLPNDCEGETFFPLDYKYYWDDGEDLFEADGIIEYLNQAKHAFDRRGLKLEWENEIDDYKDNYWNHRITVNGKEYIAFEGEMGLNIWGMAQYNFYKILNDQLIIQGSIERVYAISGGQQGWYVYLTEEQFDFINKHYYLNEEYERPLPLDEWTEKFKLFVKRQD